MNRPEHIRRFEEALRFPNPHEGLYRLAISLRDEGVPQIEIYAFRGVSDRRIGRRST